MARRLELVGVSHYLQAKAGVKRVFKTILLFFIEGNIYINIGIP